jgi:hypothetical protein
MLPSLTVVVVSRKDILVKRQGYNDKVIDSGFSKASEINRNDLLEYKEKKDQQTGSPCSHLPSFSSMKV